MNSAGDSLTIRSPKNVFAGLLFLAFAGVLAYSASRLEPGTLARMGPGYFPMLLAQLLALLGLGVMVSGWRAEGTPMERGDWRGLALVTAAIIAFAILLEPLGFVIAVGASSLLCTLATRPFRLVPSLLLVAGITVFCSVVFVVGLGMTVKLLP